MKLRIFVALALASPCRGALAQASGTQILIQQMRHGDAGASAAAHELLRETASLHAGEYRLLQPLAESEDSTQRLAATEILGSMGIVNPDVVQLLIPRLHDNVRSVRLAALGSLFIMRRNAAAAVPALRRLVDSSDAQLRWIAADVIGESKSVSGMGAWLTRLLADPEPSIRASAAYALDALPAAERAAVLSPLLRAVRDSDDDVLHAVLSTLGRMRTTDSTRVIAALERYAASQRDEDVRNAALSAVTEIRTGVHPKRISCVHRLNRGAGPMVFEVLHGASVRDDGNGPYRDNALGARVNSAVAFNLTLTNRGGRVLHLDLDRPVPPASDKVGVVEVSEFHTFYLFDANRVIWNLNEMLVGTTVSSPRSEFVFTRAGRTYRLQFGSWGIGQCGEPYAAGASVDGMDTTPAQLTRASSGVYRASVPERGVGRLWDWTTPGRPVDMGLYRVSFEFQLASP